MSLSPENYRNMERDSKKLINMAEMYVNGKGVDNYDLPMSFVGDEMELCSQLSEQYQKCVIAAKNAKGTEIREKYYELARQLDYYREKIQRRYNAE